jgi:imidazolonepropionase-like amidohydrolase
VTRRVVLQDAALADGTTPSLLRGMSVAIEDGALAWIRPNDSADTTDAEVVDAGGATIVPALVDCHSHLTMPGGSHWIARAADPAPVLREVARENARRLAYAGILWARDVGAPVKGGAPLSLAVRDELQGTHGAPYLRVAGTWIAAKGYGFMDVVTDSEGLKNAALGQLDLGTDLVKLYMDAPGGVKDSPFTLDAVRETVAAVHARGAKVAAHSAYLDGARVAAQAGVDSIEHGMELDDDVARTMARNGVTLVSTLSVFASWETFARTTTIERFVSEEGKQRTAMLKESSYAAIAAAKRAGVTIATGSDFGGGSVRAGHLAWEVELLVDAGLEPYEALAAATRNGGDLYGVEHAGRIGERCPADLVLVHGDPLSDPRALWRVWAVYQRGVRIA